MGENIGYSPLNNIQEKYMNTQLENLNRQLRISDVIDVLMAQSLQLMEIVNKNQKEVNRLKEELEQLELHIDNSTDSLTS
jgi:peptidoglycan hydrolase CwlO-like protein